MTFLLGYNLCKTLKTIDIRNVLKGQPKIYVFKGLSYDGCCIYMQLLTLDYSL